MKPREKKTCFAKNKKYQTEKRLLAENLLKMAAKLEANTPKKSLIKPH